MHRGISRAGLVAALLAPLIMLAPPAGAAPSSTTFVTMVSEAGEYVGRGANRLWYSGNGEIAVHRTERTATVDVHGGDAEDHFTLQFSAARGEPLTEGEYERTVPVSDDQPQLSISGDGRGCDARPGRFTVLDIGPDRLWLVYEAHCIGGAIFGEVHYNLPDDDTDLLVAPSRIDWPPEYPSVTASLVPVTLLNTSGSGLGVDSAHVSEGASDFRVVRYACSALAPGETCTFYVAFEPSRAGPRHGRLTIETTSDSGDHHTQQVPLSGTGVRGTTSWSMDSQQGDWVGDGRSYRYAPDSAAFTVNGYENLVELSVRSGPDYWSAAFHAGHGRLLLPGMRFDGATRYAFNSPGTPGMDVSGNGRGCNRLTGSFTVEHAVYEGGRLREVAISFEQRCESTREASLSGLVQWNVSDPTAPDPGEDTGPPSPVRMVEARPMVSSAAFDWQDPESWGWTRTVVRGATGTTAPSEPTTGFDVYAGRSGHTSVGGLVPSTDYSFSFFTQDASGAYSEPVTVTLSGTDLSLGSGKSAVRPGRRTWLRGVLTDVEGTGLEGREVALYSRKAGSSEWEPVKTRVTDDEGRFRVRRSPGVTTRYRAAFDGGASHLGSTAGPIKVKVATR